MISRSLILVLVTSGCVGDPAPADSGTTDAAGEPTPTADSTAPPIVVPGCDDPSLRGTLGPFERLTTTIEPAAAEWIWGAGALVADFDGDGVPSIWVTSESGIRAYELAEDSIVEVPSGLPATPDAMALHGGGVGGALADIDGDGDLDVYVTRWDGSPRDPHAEAGRNRLFVNEGGTFTDATDAAGVHGCLPEQCLRSSTASFGDMDDDGDLDLFVGGYGFMPDSGASPDEPAFLFENTGGGTFVDVSDRIPAIGHRGYTLAGGFVDLDQDGALDLYLVNDIGTVRTPNVALHNTDKGRTFTHEPDWGLSAALDGMGMGIGDLNGDGAPDFLIPGWGNAMYLQSVPGRAVWAEASQAVGLWIRSADIKAGMDVGWGSVLADLDNDGDLDALTQYGPFLGGLPKQPDAVWRNDGSPEAPQFTLASEALGGGDVAIHRGAAVVDLNRDGWLDVVKPSLDGTLSVLRARCGAASWLGIQLDQPGLNRHAVGATVTVTYGDQRATRTVRAGGASIGVGLAPEVHVGLGEAEVADDVRVRWPDGTEQSFGSIGTRQWLTLRRQD